MIKEAMQYLVGMGEAKEMKINGQTWTDKPIYRVAAPEVKPLRTDTLSSVVTYIKELAGGEGSFACKASAPMVVWVESHRSVHIMSPLTGEDLQKQTFLTSEKKECAFSFGQYYDAENFNIALQSMFLNTPDKEIMLKVVGNLREENVRSLGDDGVSQSVTAKMGIATVADVKVPNPVTLRPYRTYLEVEQPESKFVFRMKDGGRCALFEADGGEWKEAAKGNIYDYLEFELTAELKEKSIVLIR